MFNNKGALSLLNDYGGESSDDDVPGPRVSTKRTFKEDNETVSFKKRYKNYCLNFFENVD